MIHLIHCLPPFFSLQLPRPKSHTSETSAFVGPNQWRLYLFPLNGGRPYTYEFTDYRGGCINVPADRYKVVCVNSDTESVLYRNIDLFDSFEAYAPDGVLSVGAFLVPRAEGIDTNALFPEQPPGPYSS